MIRDDSRTDEVNLQILLIATILKNRYKYRSFRFYNKLPHEGKATKA